MPVNASPAFKATVREFAEQIREISPSMREIEVSIAVERLREEHGIKIKRATLLQLAR
jgi:hypothetical protein